MDEKTKDKLLKIRSKCEWTKEISNEKLLELDATFHSIRQGGIQGHGAMLENEIEKYLAAAEVYYDKQITIDHKGIITPRGNKKNTAAVYHIVDFVIGNFPIEIGRSITEYMVVSCKTTCRERWTQDDWSFKITPRMYVLVTLSNDYPSKDRFRESPIRKIITSSPKVRDNRIDKLGFDDLHDLITAPLGGGPP